MLKLHDFCNRARASTTLGGQIGNYFLSLQVNGERSWNTIRNLAGNEVTSPGLNSMSSSFSGTLTASGTLFQAPAGPVTIDGSLGATTSDTTVRQGNAAGQQNSPRYSSLSGQAGITLPITRKGQGMLGSIGDLSIGGRLDYSQASAFGRSIAVTSTLDWTVFEGLRIALSRASSPGLPGASAVLAPIVMRPGTLVYDASRDAVVPVTIITGGRDTLSRSASSATNISAEFHKSTPIASMTASFNYMTSETTNPLISISNPSPLAQRIFPDLFIRDASGALVEFDARPFNALRQTNREIALSLRLSGRLGSKSVDAPSDETKVRTAANEGAGPVWDFGVTYSYVLQRRLVLGNDQGSVDVLANPLALTGTPRGRLNLQWALGWKKFGANGNVSWESGARVRAIDDLAGAPVRYSPLTKVGLEIFAELARSSALDNPASLRVKVGVDNIFNKRLRVTGIPGYDNAVQRILSDPYGRTVKVSIRKAF